ncbi:hypothetical protein NC653_029326 [Populus alba x Populus x berolinensis]|uniref:ATPase AAA-type core domain-containing protein n=1 Tax=Populus alba x Populus x berolinensis TaxID=444605 RepID=A0AAD6M2W7_9ROSI|nr:hypothetical protein NC653_029326 [Populus alba x Populus x berolinensis]
MSTPEIASREVRPILLLRHISALTHPSALRDEIAKDCSNLVHVSSAREKRKLYTNDSGNKWQIYRQTSWSHIVFEHPATFETLAMEPAKEEEIIEDLVTFSKSKHFYARTGRTLKLGYLLYGPPGTGKSTMIAAMANLLKYDVYDLELTAVKDDTELRKLLIERTKKEEKSPDECKETTEKDIRKEHKEESSSKVTLSGLLNFIDELWSACGGERLIVFTTNYVKKLDKKGKNGQAY